MKLVGVSDLGQVPPRLAENAAEIQRKAFIEDFFDEFADRPLRG